MMMLAWPGCELISDELSNCFSSIGLEAAELQMRV
jgi:hypothetical protein